MLNNDILFLPRRFEYHNKISRLIALIRGEEEIKRIMGFTNVSGYALLDMMDLRIHSKSKIGYSYVEIREELNRKP